MRILVLAAAIAGCVSAQSSENQLLREIFAELMSINTAVDSGQTTPAALAMAKRLRAAGFPESDIHVFGPAPHKHNLVVRYRGAGGRKPLLLLAHLDVVEAKREDWTIDPFVLTEKDGFFYGRGTGDQKAMCAIWIANLIRWTREGYKPDRDLIVARCSSCHSVDYVQMNAPVFDRTGWQKSVRKMIDTFGAPITEDDARRIVDYLANNS